MLAAHPQHGERTRFEGVIRTVTAFYTDNGAAILKVEPCGGPRSGVVAVRGRASGMAPAPGLLVKGKGKWVNHQKWGMQIQAFDLVVEPPTGAEGLVLHLTSVLPGVGEKTARRLVEIYGENLPSVLDTRPMNLAAHKGISEAKARKIAAAWQAHRGTFALMATLRDIGLSEGYARRVHEFFGEDVPPDEIMAKLRENPYLLSEVRGIGFPTADGCAAHLGIGGSDQRRLRAGIVHALDEAVGRGGYTGLHADKLQAQAAQVLRIPAQDFRPVVDELIETGKLAAFADGFCQPVKLAEQEQAIADALARLSIHAPATYLAETVEACARRLYPQVSDGQCRALEITDAAPFAILTGGPGMGKTTLTRIIVERVRQRNERLHLASPTGRAAQKLAEATGEPAKTVHRLLGFGRDEADDLKGALIICDEASMLDTFLAAKLTQAVAQAPGARLLLVGDSDQIPSVGPGCVLGDIIASGRFPVARLTEVFRQAEGSGIAAGAQDILAGTAPDFEASADLHLRECAGANETAEQVVRLTTGLAARHGADNVQVLSPMRRGEAGVLALNARLSQALNPRSNPGAIECAQGLIREGDRVVQTKNDYERDVFNGDIGVVARIEPDTRTLHVEFTGRGELTLAGDALDAIAPAFALTVHKSQGGQYPYVVVAVDKQHTALLDRNLIYTAITRAEKGAAVVGQREALATACRTSGTWRRETRLVQRLCPQP